MAIRWWSFDNNAAARAQNPMNTAARSQSFKSPPKFKSFFSGKNVSNTIGNFDRSLAKKWLWWFSAWKVNLFFIKIWEFLDKITHIVYIDWDVGSKAHCIIILWCTIIPIGMVAATSWKFRSSANGLYLVVLPLLYLYFWVEVDSTLSVRSAV